MSGLRLELNYGDKDNLYVVVVVGFFARYCVVSSRDK